MPKPLGQDAESIIDQTAAQKKATASTYNWQGLSPLAYLDQILNMKQSQTAANNQSSAKKIALPYQSFNQDVVQSPRDIAFQEKAQMDAANRIPLPGTQSGNRPLNTTLDTPMGTGMNLKPEDYQNLAGKSALDILAMYMPRNEIDTRFPMGVTEADAMNYLMDNYAWLFPEQTIPMPPTNTTPTTPTDNMGGVPMPDMGGWGGGGYGQKDYLRDSGLINWRI